MCGEHCFVASLRRYVCLSTLVISTTGISSGVRTRRVYRPHVLRPRQVRLNPLTCPRPQQYGRQRRVNEKQRGCPDRPVRLGSSSSLRVLASTVRFVRSRLVPSPTSRTWLDSVTKGPLVLHVLILRTSVCTRGQDLPSSEIRPSSFGTW